MERHDWVDRNLDVVGVLVLETKQNSPDFSVYDRWLCFVAYFKGKELWEYLELVIEVHALSFGLILWIVIDRREGGYTEVAPLNAFYV